MIRYRCPHCAALIAAHERRVGQSSVCKSCVKPHPIPADPSRWLGERGEQLHPAPPVPAESPGRFEPTDTPPEVAAGTNSDLELPPPIAPAVEFPPILIDSQPARPAPAPTPVRFEVPAESEAAPVEPPGAVATLAPPPAREHSPHQVGGPRRAAPSPVRPLPNAPAHADPVQLQTQADIAVALTAALASRMKPPPAPRRDLRPSTAAWMLLTGLGAAFVIVALFTDSDYRWPALVIGTAEVVAGYVWIVRLTHARDATRGAICAIPPLTFYYLGRYKYAKLRPLRFVLSGALIAGAALAVPSLAPRTQAWLRRDESPPVAAPDPAAMSKLERLRYYRERPSNDALVKLLEALAMTDPLLSEDAKDREELSAEFQALCRHRDPGVKVNAMAAYARWDPANARGVCLAAARSPRDVEREMALRLLPQWKDDEAAQAVQSLIGSPGTVETNKAKEALEKLGGPPAEAAALKLLRRTESQATKLTALSILEKVGGPDSVEALRRYARACDDPPVQARAFEVANLIESRGAPPPP